MKGSWVYLLARSIGGATVGLVVVAIALITGLIAPAPAGAVPHANDPLNTYWGVVEPGGNGCSSCHTLKASEGAPNTNYIIATSRTFPDMKAANGGATPV